APRAGRGRPLGARQRRDLWQVFDDVNAGLAEGGLTTWSGVCHAAARAIDAAGRRPYDHVVADEAQDLGPAELRFLRSLVKQGPDDIFLSGDAGQQIFRRSFSWLSAGLDVRGRSTRLTVNYRTTEQIRRFADHVLPVSVSGLVGDAARRGSVSLLNGREPECRAADTVPEEVALVADWLEDLFSTGYRPRDVAVFARTKKLLDERAVPAVERLGRGWHALKDDESPDPNRVAIGTMHRAKGLEFRAVGVVGCQDGIMPLERVARRQADEADRDLFLARERNLLYVACTRAQRRLLVTWVGRPSRFLGEVVDGPNGDAA
ncbi:MAG: 3'-5' exonuclease, partial [Anaerolineae bacterium]